MTHDNGLCTSNQERIKTRMKTPIRFNSKNLSWLLMKVVIKHWPPYKQGFETTRKAKAIVKHFKQNESTSGRGSRA